MQWIANPQNRRFESYSVLQFFNNSMLGSSIGQDIRFSSWEEGFDSPTELQVLCGYDVMVTWNLAKVYSRVRFSLPAPFKGEQYGSISCVDYIVCPISSSKKILRRMTWNVEVNVSVNLDPVLVLVGTLNQFNYDQPLVALTVAHLTLNQWGVGSNPTGWTNYGGETLRWSNWLLTSKTRIVPEHPYHMQTHWPVS